jgi:hypothetical protein
VRGKDTKKPVFGQERFLGKRGGICPKDTAEREEIFTHSIFSPVFALGKNQTNC